MEVTYPLLAMATTIETIYVEILVEMHSRAAKTASYGSRRRFWSFGYAYVELEVVEREKLGGEDRLVVEN